MDTTMGVEKLFDVVRTYEEFNLTLWNIYIAVALGISGYAIGSDKIRQLAPRLVLLLTFAVFAAGNCHYLERNLVLVNGFAKAIAETNEIGSPELKKSLVEWKDRQPETIWRMHLAIDVLIALIILIGPPLIAKERKAKSGSQSG